MQLLLTGVVFPLIALGQLVLIALGHQVNSNRFAFAPESLKRLRQFVSLAVFRS